LKTVIKAEPAKLITIPYKNLTKTLLCKQTH
jgi:hypothetical protein